MRQRLLAFLLPILILIVVGVGGVMMLNALVEEPEKVDAPPAALSVFAERAEAADLQLTVKTQGEVTPVREIVVSPQIGGRIDFVSPDFIDGGFIRNGQVLVRIEPDDFELGVVRARSSVASAEQRLAREQAESELAIQDLRDLGLENPSPLARREPQLAEARAALDAAKSQLADAELALKRTAVTAPFSGRVRSRAADIGQFVSPGQNLGTIFASDAVQVALPLTDPELGRLGLPIAFSSSAAEPGPEVVFTARVGGEERRWVGEVKRTAASVNPQTRLISVFAELEDPFGAGADDGVPMAPGLFVNAEIKGPVAEGLVRIPRAGLRSDERVFVGEPEAGEIRIREGRVVYSDSDGAFLSGGVSSGELVVVSPVQAAFDGMSVRVLERTPDGAIITYEPGEAPVTTVEAGDPLPAAASVSAGANGEEG